MKPHQKIRLNNNLSYLSIVVLVFYVVLTLALVILPQLPNYPDEPGDQRLFVSSWSFACTLMWIMVFRIQALNVLSDVVGRKQPGRFVTPWVKFWFIASIFTGSAATIYVLHSFTLGSSGSPIYVGVLPIISIAVWIMLIALSTLLFFSRKKYSKKMFSNVEKALLVHRWILAPASLLFFCFTFLFPIFFLL
jgi:hypothetical protein